MSSTPNLKKALIDPSDVYRSPGDILLDRMLSREQKINLLKRWESNILVEQVAQEEGMPGKAHLATLEHILDALKTLDAIIDTEDTPPTKAGG